MDEIAGKNGETKSPTWSSVVDDTKNVDWKYSHVFLCLFKVWPGFKFSFIYTIDVFCSSLTFKVFYFQNVIQAGLLKEGFCAVQDESAGNRLIELKMLEYGEL